ncbi:hypothetical protein V498_08987, partial [Pseudogymnoascus sp. VKM F-4517 (FW-2822)]
MPSAGSWSFARPALTRLTSTEPATNHWPMPHFSFWTWPNPLVGPFDAVLDKISKIESATRWVDKIDKAIWRGTVWFSPIGNKELRKTLVKLAKGKEWADIEPVRSDERNSTTGGVVKGNKMAIEEFWRIILRPPRLPPSLRLRSDHTSPHLPPTHHASPPTPLLTHPRHTTAPAPRMALPPRLRSKHHLRAARLVGFRSHYYVVARELRGGGGDSEEREGGGGEEGDVWGG